MKSSISICMATYNGSDYIREQLDSILLQLSGDDEIVISDDHSSDDTIERLKALGDPRIKIFYNTGERGFTSNFENALRHAANPIIFLSDQDDIWLPSKVACCMERLTGGFDLVVHDAVVVDENKNVLHDSFYHVRHVHKTLIGNLVKFGYLGCCMAFRREILEVALPFPTNRKCCLHDNWLYLVGSAFFKSTIVNEKLILYRRHTHNTSTGGIGSSTTTVGFKLKYRFYLLCRLIGRLRLGRRRK